MKMPHTVRTSLQQPGWT